MCVGGELGEDGIRAISRGGSEGAELQRGREVLLGVISKEIPESRALDREEVEVGTRRVRASMRNGAEKVCGALCRIDKVENRLISSELAKEGRVELGEGRGGGVMVKRCRRSAVARASVFRP